MNSGRVVIPALYVGMLRQRMNSLYPSDSALPDVPTQGLTQGLCCPQALVIKAIQLIQNTVVGHRDSRGVDIRYPGLFPCSAVCPLRYPDAELQRGRFALTELL